MEKTYKIVIVEDEMIIGANISLQLTHLGYEVTGIVPRAEEVLHHLTQNPPHIILLDINLKGELDGVDLAHVIQKNHNIPIIFLTANSDEVNFNRAKTTNPHAFISKPFKKLDLQRAIELTVARIEKDEKASQKSTEETPEPFVLTDAIFVRSHDKMVKVSLDNILYIEAERNYCKIHARDKEHLLVMTMKDLEEKLVSKKFLRIHRSFIVNISHIDEIATSHVVIAKKAIPLSAELKKYLLQSIQKV